MRSTKYISRIGWIFVVAALLSACSEATEESSAGNIDGRHDSFIVDGKGDIPNTIHEGTPEARAILKVANTYSLHSLVADVDLYWKTAYNVVGYRKGEDDRPNTDDDQEINSLGELDEIFYVGPSALRRFRKHVKDNDLIEYGDVEISEEIPDVVDTSGVIFRHEIAAGEEIEVDVDAEPGDRVLMWFRKADNPSWNPKMTIYDRKSGDTVEWANPWGDADARLPKSNDDLDVGWEFDEPDIDYGLRLENTSDVDGFFEFALECIGGGCYAGGVSGEEESDGDDDDVLRDQDLRAKLVADHERNHIFLSYYNARYYMFSWVDNNAGDVACVYTGREVTTDEIPDHYVMNAEHTWPQSKGAVDGSARTDLHHLYPVLSSVNSLRANHPFCEVDEVIRDMDGALLGYDEDGVRCFEPRASHKGNAARSLFYFATVYQQSIEDGEEEVLRSWAQQDPIDDAERSRNSAVEVIQGSRNPFIDHPEYIGRISDF